ncbi:MAG: hypothetical protein M1818_006139 [Claussenomyces sp. TS43310]|nr:MAG: hypothetical protein M1818_006139 [Claussenomyces sp. TS43310]
MGVKDDPKHRKVLLPVPDTSYHRRAISEDTPLLAAVTDVPYNHASQSPDETLPNEDLYDGEIDPNMFDLMVTRTISRGGLGMEAESQETPMLRGARRYSSAKSRRSSLAAASRRSLASDMGDEEAVINDDEDDEVKPSPFLGGVTVRRFWFIYGGTLANLFIACFDTTIMASSHPVITSYFNSSNSASWLSTSFLLTSTAFQPLFGRLSDTTGRKVPYMFTLVTFLIGTVWCTLAQSMTEFIIARAVCGLGAGGMLSLGSIITSDLVPIETRGVYQSYINIVYGLGSALGAATGGAIADQLGWRWEFGVQVPLIAVCTLAAFLAVPGSLGLREGETKENVFEAIKAFDYGGSIVLSTSITFLILGLVTWSHPFIVASLCIFAVGFPLFLWIESRASRPIMPLAIIRHAPRANIIFSNALAAIIVNAVLFNVPLYIQAVLLKSATNSGLQLIVPAVASAISGTMTGFLVTWSKRLKWPMTCGILLMVVGTCCLSLALKEMPGWLYLLFLVPSAVGQGFMFPGCFLALLVVSEQSEQAVVTSTLILWRSLGNVLGVALSSLAVQNALVIYLNKMVTGPDKEKVILQVRESVQAILKLDPHYQAQVVDAYAASLRVAFVMLAVLSLVASVIILPVKMPRLGKR